MPVNCAATKNGCDRKRWILRARDTISLSSSLSSSMPKNRDDVLQVLVLLERLLHRACDAVVTIADDLRIEHRRRRVERIDCRINSERREIAREDRRRIQVRERRGRRGVGQVVGGDVDGLNARDRAFVGRRDALLKSAHFGRQRGLITDGGGDSTEERGHFRARLREAENVVDEQENVLSFFVSEYSADGERAQRDARASSRRLIHLAVNQSRFRDDGLAGLELRFIHFQVEVVAFARALADACEAAHTAVRLRDVVDELHDEDGFCRRLHRRTIRFCRPCDTERGGR